LAKLGDISRANLKSYLAERRKSNDQITPVAQLAHEQLGAINSEVRFSAISWNILPIPSKPTIQK